MIMATKLLNQRIKDVMCARKRAGKADITPTLVDLERTHILYVNAHFKPFAAIGSTPAARCFILSRNVRSIISELEILASVTSLTVILCPVSGSVQA